MPHTFLRSLQVAFPLQAHSPSRCSTCCIPRDWRRSYPVAKNAMTRALLLENVAFVRVERPLEMSATLELLFRVSSFGNSGTRGWVRGIQFYQLSYPSLSTPSWLKAQRADISPSSGHLQALVGSLFWRSSSDSLLERAPALRDGDGRNPRGCGITKGRELHLKLLISCGV